MGAVQGDLIQITDKQRYLGQKVLNVYYYRTVPILGIPTAQYEDVLDLFESIVMDKIRVEQATLLEHEELELRNLSNGLDLLARPLNDFGLLSTTSADAAPSFVSLGFKLVRESLVTRNGYKRIAGLNEERVDGNGYSFGVGSQVAIEAALAADFVFAGTTILEPIIVKRPIPAAPIASYQYSSIGAASFALVGTQNTRKAGRGD